MRWVKASERMPTEADLDADGEVLTRWQGANGGWSVMSQMGGNLDPWDEWLEGALADVQPSPNGRGNHSVGPDHEPCECSQHVAEVTMFGKTRLCRVQAWGEPHASYPPERTLWVERAEDYYAMPHYKPPFCVLTKEAWQEAERDELASQIREQRPSRFDASGGSK